MVGVIYMVGALHSEHTLADAILIARKQAATKPGGQYS